MSVSNKTPSALEKEPRRYFVRKGQNAFRFPNRYRKVFCPFRTKRLLPSKIAREGILFGTDKTPSVFLIDIGRYFVRFEQNAFCFLRDSLFENKYQEGILSEKIFCLRRYFGGRYFVREDILAEGILSEKVFRRRRYFVLEGIMSGYQ